MTEEVYNDPKKLQDVYSDIDIYSGLAAVVAVQFVIGAIIVIKYTEDIVDTFIRGTGSVPYPGQDLNKRHRTK